MQNEQPEPGPSRAPLARLLVNQNPFYVISSACVIHGSSYWFRENGNGSPWQLMALVGGFILLLTVIGFCVVRFGRLWDDARSIFVMLFLLFAELALSFDDVFISDWREGSLLFVCGWLFAVAVFEFLFLSLQIRLRALYRVPFHLMLSMLFLYPLTMVWAIQNSEHRVIQWQLLGFNLAVAGGVVLLIPAIRKGIAYCQPSGTPWRWPLFPWIPFGVMIGALCIRSFAMCASLDAAILQSVTAARQLQSIFCGYFLCPIILAVALVLLELGIVNRNSVVKNVALVVPGLACFLAFPSKDLSTLQLAFLNDVTETVAAPLLVTLATCTIFYGVAAARGIRVAEWWLSIVAMELLYVTGDSNIWSPAATLQFWSLSGIIVFHILLGIRRRSVLQALTGVLLASVPLHHAAVESFGWEFCVAVEVHVLLLAVLVLAISSGHRTLVSLTAFALALFAVVAVFPPFAASAEVASIFRYSYTACLVVGTATLFCFTRFWPFFNASIAGLVALSSVAARQVWLAIRHIDGWQGLVFYGAGLFWLLVAIVISFWKSRISSTEK